MVAGESSGDVYGGLVAKEIRQLSDTTALVGLSGPEMTAAGVLLPDGLNGIRGISDLGVFGFWEGMRNAVRSGRITSAVKDCLEATPPDVFVPISYSGVNLPIALHARALGIPVAYLSPPQVWAWGGWRKRKLRRATDRVLCILPFEPELLRRSGVNACYLGNPLTDAIPASASVSDEHAADAGVHPCLLLMPGSRESEVARHLPLMRAVGNRLKQQFPDLDVRELLTGCGDLNQRYRIMRQATVILAASGTVTLEAALMRVPIVAIYRLSAPSYIAARLAIRLSFFSLPNLILNRRVVPEFSQPETGTVYAAVRTLLAETQLRSRMQVELAEVRDRLGPPGAARRIARAILDAATHRQS